MQLERLCQRQRWACGVVVIVRRHVFEATCANGCLFGHVPLRFWEWYMCHKKKTICTRLITWLTRLTKNVCVFLGWRNCSSYPLNDFKHCCFALTIIHNTPLACQMTQCQTASLGWSWSGSMTQQPCLQLKCSNCHFCTDKITHAVVTNDNYPPEIRPQTRDEMQRTTP